jgi:hypothetical protein
MPDLALDGGTEPLGSEELIDGSDASARLITSFHPVG